MDWSKDIIEEFIKELKVSNSIGEALDKVDPSVSGGALRAAFQRYAYEAPSYYLGSELEGRVSAQKAPDSPPEPTPYTYTLDFDKNAYTWLLQGGKKCTMSFEDAETMAMMYSSVSPGMGRTAEEVATYLYNERGYDWVDPKTTSAILKAMGQTKKRAPECPHQLGQDYQTVYDKMRFKRNAAISQINDSKTSYEMAKEIEDLKDELEAVTNIIGKAGSLVDGPVAKLHVKDMGHDDSTLIVFLSDIHAGKSIESKPLSGMTNEYSQKILRERTELICSIIERESWVCDHVDRILFLNLGDNLESLFSNNREGMWEQMYGTGFSNWKDVVDMNVQVIRQLEDSFNVPIDCLFIEGNHTRASKVKDGYSGRILIQILAERISQDFKDDPAVTIQVGEPVTSVMLPHKVNLLAQHGDLKIIKPKDESFAQFVRVHGDKSARRTITCQGHLHFCSITYHCDGMSVQVPSIVGVDDYAANNLHKSNPAQFLMLLSNRHEDRPLGPFNLQRDDY